MNSACPTPLARLLPTAVDVVRGVVAQFFPLFALFRFLWITIIEIGTRRCFWKKAT